MRLVVTGIVDLSRAAVWLTWDRLGSHSSCHAVTPPWAGLCPHPVAWRSLRAMLLSMLTFQLGADGMKLSSV